MLAQPGPRQVVLRAGESSALLTLATVDDDEDEPDSTVTATVAEGSGYTLGAGRSSASVLVTDTDEPQPVVTIAAAASEVTEGTPVQFTVSADRMLAAGLTVNVAVSESRSMLSGSLPQSVTLPAGAGSAALTVNTDDDSVEEGASTVTATVQPGARVRDRGPGLRRRQGGRQRPDAHRGDGFRLRRLRRTGRQSRHRRSAQADAGVELAASHARPSVRRRLCQCHRQSTDRRVRRPPPVRAAGGVQGAHKPGTMAGVRRYRADP